MILMFTFKVYGVPIEAVAEINLNSFSIDILADDFPV